MNEFIIFLFLVIILASIFWSWQSYRDYKLSKTLWRLKFRVAEIEYQVVRKSHGSGADVFVMFLANLIINDDKLREIHGKFKSRKSHDNKQAVNIRKHIKEIFGDEDVELVSEALILTAKASLLMTKTEAGSNFAENDIICREQFHLLREITKPSFPNLNLFLSDSSVQRVQIPEAAQA